MLTDAEIVLLRQQKQYQKRIGTGLEGLVTDLIRSGNDDFKPELSTIVKITYGIAKARIIRKELSRGGSQLLERLLNYELKWPRSPDSVRELCEADKNYMWLRYDTPRVVALLGRAKSLLTDAQYRDLIKQRSSIQGNKNDRLEEIGKELDVLKSDTLRSIATRGLYDSLIHLRADEHYAINEQQIQQEFLRASQGGPLGLLPTPKEEDPK